MGLSFKIQNNQKYFKIQYTDRKGKVEVIYLGYDEKEAKYHSPFIDALIELSKQANPIYRDNILDYLKETKEENPSLYKKLDKKGLVVKGEEELANDGKLTLGRLAELFLAFPHDVEDTTNRITTNAFKRLFEHFSKEMPIDELNLERIKLFQKWIYGKYAEATASRFVKKYRQLFAWGIKHKYLTDNIFAEMKVGSMVNEERQQYIPTFIVQKLIDCCVTDELRFALFLARWCSFRIPSECNKLRWSNFDFDEKTFFVTGKKNKIRKVPIFDDERCDMYPFISELLTFHNCESFVRDIDGLSQLEIKSLLQKNGNSYFYDMAKHYEKGQDYVFSLAFRERKARSNQMDKLKHKAKVDFKKDFQNLRTSSETDMVRYYGIDAAVKWTGNSKKVALEHYLQIPPETWDSAKGEDVEIKPIDETRQFLTDKELIKVLIRRYKIKKLQQMILDALKEEGVK